MTQCVICETWAGFPAAVVAKAHETARRLYEDANAATNGAVIGIQVMVSRERFTRLSKEFARKAEAIRTCPGGAENTITEHTSTCPERTEHPTQHDRFEERMMLEREPLGWQRVLATIRAVRNGGTLDRRVILRRADDWFAAVYPEGDGPQSPAWLGRGKTVAEAMRGLASQLDAAADEETKVPAWHPLMANVLKEVTHEREKQQYKWGQQDHHPFTYLAILGEEVGEANQAACQSLWGGMKWADYRTELVQIAAVAVAMIECHDRNGPPAPLKPEERKRYWGGEPKAPECVHKEVLYPGRMPCDGLECVCPVTCVCKAPPKGIPL